MSEEPVIPEPSEMPEPAEPPAMPEPGGGATNGGGATGGSGGSAIENAYWEDNVGRNLTNRLRIFNIILAIPLLIVGYALRIILGIIFILSWFSVLFAGRVPHSFYGLLRRFDRYLGKVGSYIFLFIPGWPSFDMPAELRDSEGYGVKIHYPEYPGSSPRWGIFAIIILVPHIVWMMFLGIWWLILTPLNWLKALFTGRLMDYYVDYTIRLNTYALRVELYLWMVNMQRYPSFSLNQ